MPVQWHPQCSRRFHVDLAVCRSLKLRGLATVQDWEYVLPPELVHICTMTTPDPLCVLSLTPSPFRCPSWTATPALPQISAQLNWCALADLKVDRFGVGQMLLGASALNFYSVLLEKKKLHYKSEVYTVQDFYKEFGATACRENVILHRLGVISNMNIHLWS